MTSLDETKFQALKNAIVDKIPCCGGILPVSAHELVLFYGKGPDARRIDLLETSEEQLEDLSRACDPATFGANQKDVLDESYRKARKLDAGSFALTFNLQGSGLIDIIRSELLGGDVSNKEIVAEGYKLNVYGKDSFFKSHKDTPRGDRMFGSLVIILPTPHEGGSLLLSHGDNKWAFDSGKQLASVSESAIAYVAFYSDVEHEITHIKSGHRISVTYNLYFASNNPSKSIIPVPSPDETAFKNALTSLLADVDVFPNGGSLGFGLRHEYPVSQNTDLKVLMQCLKGSDAVIGRVCDQLSLTASLKFVYIGGGSYSDDVIVDKIANLRGVQIYYEEESLSDQLQSHFGGKRVRPLGNATSPDPVPGEAFSGTDGDEEHYDPIPQAKEPVEIYWVTEMTEFAKLEQEYVVYGNEPAMSWCYGNVCLLVNIGPPGKRDL